MAHTRHPRLGTLLALAVLTLCAVSLTGPATAGEDVRIIVTDDKDRHHGDRHHERLDRGHHRERFHRNRYGAPSFGIHFGSHLRGPRWGGGGHFDRHRFDRFDRHRGGRGHGKHRRDHHRSNHRANVPDR